MIDKQFVVSDGRQLGYTSFGNTSGYPVIFFHGSPGSRYEGGVVDDTATTNHIHLIGVDRPGYGQSDKKNDRSISDWVKDVEELLNHLHLEKVDIIGVSGGAPYALACAEQLGNRLRNVAIVCGLIPMDTIEGSESVAEEEHKLFQAAQHAPEQIIQKINQIHHNPENLANDSKDKFPEIDQAVFTPELLQKWLKSIKEATRSPEGMISDYKLFGHPWGINVEKINVPVYFWHGDLDDTIFIHGVKSFVERIPGAKLEVIEGAGHIGTGIVGTERAIQLFAKEK